MTLGADLPRGEALAALLGAPRAGRLERIVCRLGHGRHACPPSAHLTRADGLVGDRWRPEDELGRQLTIMDVRVIRALLAHAAPLRAPELALDAPEALDLPGDNLVVDLATGVGDMPPGTRLRIGEALVETNAVPHLGCKKFEARFGGRALAWVNDAAHRGACLRGLNGFVVEDGLVRAGDAVVVERRGAA